MDKRIIPIEVIGPESGDGRGRKGKAGAQHSDYEKRMTAKRELAEARDNHVEEIHLRAAAKAKEFAEKIKKGESIFPEDIEDEDLEEEIGIPLFVAMTDDTRKKEMRARGKSADGAAVSEETVDGALLSEYKAAHAAVEERSFNFFGDKVNFAWDVAKTKKLGNAERRLEEKVEDIRDTGGIKELEDVLAEEGLALVCTPKGKLLSFSARPFTSREARAYEVFRAEEDKRPNSAFSRSPRRGASEDVWYIEGSDTSKVGKSLTAAFENQNGGTDGLDEEALTKRRSRDAELVEFVLGYANKQTDEKLEGLKREGAMEDLRRQIKQLEEKDRAREDAQRKEREEMKTYMDRDRDGHRDALQLLASIKLGRSAGGSISPEAMDEIVEKIAKKLGNGGAERTAAE